ncbi:hypothetical protein CPC08DRAFT_770415 [Agrocybe pediades]|nr:hypothetical protein CPC08DRAFT_770415 [Agrocybe pediades]
MSYRNNNNSYNRDRDDRPRRGRPSGRGGNNQWNRHREYRGGRHMERGERSPPPRDSPPRESRHNWGDEPYEMPMDDDEEMAPPPSEAMEAGPSGSGHGQEHSSIASRDKGKGKARETYDKEEEDSALGRDTRRRLRDMGLEDSLIDEPFDQRSLIVINELLLRLQETRAEAATLQARNEILTMKMSWKKRAAPPDSDEDKGRPPQKRSTHHPGSLQQRLTEPSSSTSSYHGRRISPSPERGQWKTHSHPSTAGPSNRRPPSPPQLPDRRLNAPRHATATYAQVTERTDRRPTSGPTPLHRATAPQATTSSNNVVDSRRTIRRPIDVTTRRTEASRASSTTLSVTVRVPGPVDPAPAVMLDPTPEEDGTQEQEDDDHNGSGSGGPSDSELSMGSVDGDGKTRTQAELAQRRARNQKLAKTKKNAKAAREHARQRAQLEDNGRIPDFWGVVNTPNFSIQRNNSFRGMLTRHAYYSRYTNAVYMRDTGIAAQSYERLDQRGYTPQSTHPIYRLVPFGIPRHPADLNRLRSILRDTRTASWARGEALDLILEFRHIAQQTTPSLRDRVMDMAANMPSTELDVSLPERDTRPILIPIDTSRIALGNINNSTRGLGIAMPARENYLNVDEVAQYALLHGRPGTVNHFHGIAMDVAFRVYRPSVFGYGLARMLAPMDSQARSMFYNADHPASPFIAQTGPAYTITRSTLTDDRARNLCQRDVIDLLIANRIPVEWIDHSYSYGYQYLSQRYDGSLMDQALLASVDDERIRRLATFGVPPTIADMDSWRYPTEDDLTRVHALMAMEEDADPSRRSLDAPGWLYVGEDPVQQYLPNRPPDDIEAAYRDQPSIPTMIHDATGTANAEPTAMVIDEESGSANADPDPSTSGPSTEITSSTTAATAPPASTTAPAPTDNTTTP